jgi:hypothetical protein
LRSFSGGSAGNWQKMQDFGFSERTYSTRHGAHRGCFKAPPPADGVARDGDQRARK